jgi:hypothetical protein
MLRALAELELEQREALREDDVLIDELRHDRRIVEEDGEHEQERYGE